MSAFQKIWIYVRPFKARFFFILFLGVIMSALMTAAAALLKPLFNEGFQFGNQEALLRICLTYVGIIALHGTCRFFHMSMLIYLSERVTVAVQQDLQQKYMTLSHRFHGTSDTGGYISRVLNDVNTIKWGMMIMADIVREPIQIVGLLGLALYLDAKLTIMTFVVAPLIVFILGRVGRSVRKYSYRQQENLEKFTSTLKETFDGLRVIQSFNLESEMKMRLRKVADLYLGARRKIINRQEVASPITEFIGVAVFAATAFYMGSRVAKGQATQGDFVAYVGALGMLQNPIKKLQDAYVRIQPTIASIERIFSVLEDTRVVPEVANPVLFPSDFTEINFNKIVFGYAGQPILHGIDLTVKRGEVIAIVGESGSGKSTLMNLLERFIDPDKGDISLISSGKRIPIRDMSLKDLRANIGLVTQDVFLFNESIERNIQSGNFDHEVISAHESASLANAIEFIEKKPQGFATLVGERGSSLSGGEKQRISIARAIYKNAPILILDEATSALDSASEVEVQKGLDHLMEGRTTFVIAHRLSTVINADRILVMEHGHIVEQGSHAELLKRAGPYSKFYQLQTQA